MPVDLAARILAHDTIAPNHFLMTLEARGIARAARPGQFVMLQVDEGRDPLLRRPMSVCRVVGGRPSRVQILYKVVGEGTRRLARQRAGEHLLTLGPLGNGFRLPAGRRGRARAQEQAVLVAGGVGIAIFPFLVDALLRRGERPVLLYGARTAKDLVALNMFRSRGVDVRLATEDGTRGTKGYVTAILEPLLRQGLPRPTIYACGPTPMLRAVGALAVDSEAPCQLALESQMPCGIGVCLGCVVACPGDAAGPVYRRVCTEGPVFDAHAVRL